MRWFRFAHSIPIGRLSAEKHPLDLRSGRTQALPLTPFFSFSRTPDLAKTHKTIACGAGTYPLSPFPGGRGEL